MKSTRPYPGNNSYSMSRKRNFEHYKNLIRQPNSLRLIVLAVILIACFLRVKLYSDPALSIAGNDTQSYIDSSRASLSSREFFTGRRLFSTNLLYKLFVPNDYEIRINGSIETSHLSLQPGFETLAVFQFALSVIGWSFLAFTFAEFIKDPLMKILGAGIIVLFAFTPQMADWDSILMSESPTFSLFAIQFSLTIWIVFSLYKNPASTNTIAGILWAFVFFLWVFLRDSNLYVIIIYIGAIVLTLAFAKYRKNKFLQMALLYLLVIFAIGVSTSSQSSRFIIQLVNVYHDDIFPNPLRVQILQEMGMPPPGSDTFNEWLGESGGSAYIKFAITHPGYTATKLTRDFPPSFREIKQTYFRATELEPVRTYLIMIGEGLHAENYSPFLIDVILVASLIYIALKSRNEIVPWTVLGTILFLSSTITISAAIMGDTWALNRHALFSTMSYRLLTWMLLVVFIDNVVTANTRQPAFTSGQ